MEFEEGCPLPAEEGRPFVVVPGRPFDDVAECPVELFPEWPWLAFPSGPTNLARYGQRRSHGWEKNYVATAGPNGSAPRHARARLHAARARCVVRACFYAGPRRRPTLRSVARATHSFVKLVF